MAFIILAFTCTTLGYVKLTAVSGASNTDLTNNKIYAGYAGTCAAPDSGSLCNTCTDTTELGLKPCNQKSIHPALSVAFSFTSSADLSATATNPARDIALFIGDDTTNTQVVSGKGLASNTAMSLSTTWGAFCSAVGATAGLNNDCSVSTSADQTVSTTKHFYIGADEDGVNGISSTEKLRVEVNLHSISSTNTGIHTQPYCAGSAAAGFGMCFYALTTGDEKLIILGSPEPLSNSTTPSNSPGFQAAVFFPFQTPTGLVDVNAISNGSKVSPVIKNFTSTTDLSISGDPYISGLTNEVRYCVIAAQMNLAQNIFGFTTTGLVEDQVCQTTSPVVGLLDDKKCFISTAAFNSDMAQEVQIFRQFRDTFLLKNDYGIRFVKMYYKYGPYGAEFISNSETLKFLTRSALYPLVGFSWLALSYGLWPALLVLLLGLIFIFNFSKKLKMILNPRMTRENFKV